MLASAESEHQKLTNHEIFGDFQPMCRAIFVLELSLVLVFILFRVNNFYFYTVLVLQKSIVSVFIQFSCNNFSFFFVCAEFQYY